MRCAGLRYKRDHSLLDIRPSTVARVQLCSYLVSTTVDVLIVKIEPVELAFLVKKRPER
jgi:hypothetical protein